MTLYYSAKLIRPKICVLWIEMRSARGWMSIVVGSSPCSSCQTIYERCCDALWMLVGLVLYFWQAWFRCHPLWPFGGEKRLPPHCTVFWLSTEHDPGLNVTGISELCTMQTFGSKTACRDQEMHQLILMWKKNPEGGKTEIYLYCTVNQLARSLELLPG